VIKRIIIFLRRIGLIHRRILSPEERHKLIADFNRTCFYCHRRGTWDHDPDHNPWNIDHLEPWSKGGADDFSNYVLSCRRCNIQKGARPVRYFDPTAPSRLWHHRVIRFLWSRTMLLILVGVSLVIWILITR